ncbi:MAG: hypothetical protein ACYS6K_29680 [Planctomycetota bacterium]|jgi:hypothetical protein
MTLNELLAEARRTENTLAIAVFQAVTSDVEQNINEQNEIFAGTMAALDKLTVRGEQ